MSERDEERFLRLLRLTKEKNIRIDIALYFGKFESLREILIKLLEENKVDIVKNLEKIIGAERKYILQNILLELLSFQAFQIGKEVFEEIRKTKAMYDFYLNNLFFSLLDENIEKINEYIEKLRSLEDKMDKNIGIILQKIQ